MNLNDNITICLGASADVLDLRKSWIVEIGESGFKAKGFGDLTAWCDWSEENVRWIRGWHDPDSLAAWTLQAAWLLQR